MKKFVLLYCLISQSVISVAQTLTDWKPSGYATMLKIVNNMPDKGISIVIPEDSTILDIVILDSAEAPQYSQNELCLILTDRKERQFILHINSNGFRGLTNNFHMNESYVMKKIDEGWNKALGQKM